MRNDGRGKGSGPGSAEKAGVCQGQGYVEAVLGGDALGSSRSRARRTARPDDARMASRAQQRLVVSHRRLSQSDAAIPEKIIENLPSLQVDRGRRPIDAKLETEKGEFTGDRRGDLCGRVKTSVSDVVSNVVDR